MEPPTLTDFYNHIEDYIKTKNIDREEKQAGSALKRKLDMYVNASYRKFFNGETNMGIFEQPLESPEEILNVL
jgi:hypothetical protein